MNPSERFWRLSSEQVRAIRERYAAGHSSQQAMGEDSVL